MFIDSKGRFFGKVSIIDILVVLTILIGIVGVGLRYTRTNNGATFSGGTNLSIQIFSEEVPDFAARAVKDGAVVRDHERGVRFGTVKSIEIGDSVSYGTNIEGEFVVSHREGYASVFLEIEGYGSLNPDGGMTIENVEYLIGRTVTIRAGGAIFIGRIYDVQNNS